MKRHWHPTPTETLLLHAALDPPPAAATAWASWKNQGGDIRALSHTSLRLLPLVARNLADAGVAEPDLGVLRGVRRQSWVEHTERMRRLAPYAAALVDAGVPLLFLKGVVLAPLYYGEFGLRMLSDVDVLVRPADVPRAVATLARLGVTPRGQFPASLARAAAGETNLADEGYQHSLAFMDDDRLELDLHWAVLYPNVGPRSDDGFWARAIPFALAGARGLALSPTDQLLHVIIHGLSFSEESTVRWIPDALAVLRSPHRVDWALLVDEAARRGLSLPLAEALAYLVAELAAPVPPWVGARLAGHRPTLMDRLRYEEMLQDWTGARHAGTLLASLARFTEGRAPLDRLRVTARWFAHRVDRRGPRQVVGQVTRALGGVVRRLRGRA